MTDVPTPDASASPPSDGAAAEHQGGPTTPPARADRAGRARPQAPAALRRPRAPRAAPALAGVLAALLVTRLVAAVAVPVSELVLGGGTARPVVAGLAAADAAVALSLAAAAWLCLRRPDLERMERAVVALLLLAVTVSGLRAAVLGPWWALDALVVLAAAAALRRPRAEQLVVAGALAAWTGALAVAAARGMTLPASGWAAVVAAAAAGAVLVGHQERAGLVAELAAVHADAQAAAVTDPLTASSNRRGLTMLAAPMIEHARRSGNAVHALFLDVDRFHVVNEQAGHQAGDAVLRGVAEAVRGSVRTTDVVARWAGDQFVVVGPGTGTSPLELERRVRAQLASTPSLPPADVWEAAVSIGSATLVPWDDGDLDSLLARADQDMRLRRSLRRQGAGRPWTPPPADATPKPALGQQRPAGDTEEQGRPAP